MVIVVALARVEVLLVMVALQWAEVAAAEVVLVVERLAVVVELVRENQLNRY